MYVFKARNKQGFTNWDVQHSDAYKIQGQN